MKSQPLCNVIHSNIGRSRRKHPFPTLHALQDELDYSCCFSCVYVEQSAQEFILQVALRQGNDVPVPGGPWTRARSVALRAKLMAAF